MSWGCIAATDGRFNRIRQVAPMSPWGHIGATWQIRLNVFSLAPPGEYEWTCASFGPPEPTTQTTNRSVQPFLLVWPQSVPIKFIEIGICDTKPAISHKQNSLLPNFLQIVIRNSYVIGGKSGDIWWTLVYFSLEHKFPTADISHTSCWRATKFASQNLFHKFRELCSGCPAIRCGDMHQSFTGIRVKWFFRLPCVFRQFLTNMYSPSLHAVARRPSVVCNVHAPYSVGWNFQQYFCAIWYLGHPMTSTENFTKIIPGNPTVRGVG